MPRELEYDLEDRTLKFAGMVRKFTRHLPQDICNREDSKQLIRSSGSVGTNYIEANEALSKKDFRMRIKISRKEVKEARYWLYLIDTKKSTKLEDVKQKLIQEATELLKILSAILINSRE